MKETTLSQLNRWFKWMLWSTTIWYVLACLSIMLRNYVVARSSGIDLVSMAPLFQMTISFCLISASTAQWLPRFGKLFAVPLLIIVITCFAYWAVLTNRIKVNAGFSVLPGAGIIGNIWVGAGWLETMVLILSIWLLVLGSYLIWVERSAWKIPRTTST
jgi:hypothetical protein